MNLLPQHQKDAIHKDVLIRFLFVFLGVIFFWALIFLVLSYNTVIYLNAQTPALEERIEQESLSETSKTLAILEEDINGLNEVLGQIKKIRSKEGVSLLQVLRKIGEFVPVGVSFTTISIQGGSMTIIGHAATRDQALILKGNLEKDSICGSLSSSPSIFKEKNINFIFVCTLK